MFDKFELIPVIYKELIDFKKKIHISPKELYINPVVWKDVQVSLNYQYIFYDPAKFDPNKYPGKKYLGRLLGMEVFEDESIKGWRFES